MAGADVRCAYGCQDTACDVSSASDAAGHAVRSYRPHGSLARVLYDKRKADEWLTAYDKRKVSATTLEVQCLSFPFPRPRERRE